MPKAPLMAPDMVKVVVLAPLFLSWVVAPRVTGPVQMVLPLAKLRTLAVFRTRGLARVMVPDTPAAISSELAPVLVMGPVPNELLLLYQRIWPPVTVVPPE